MCPSLWVCTWIFFFFFFACWQDNDWFTDLDLGHSGVILWPTAQGQPIILPLCSDTVSKGQLMSLAPFSGLSIMSDSTHYKDIMRFHSELAWVMTVAVWSNLLSLSLPPPYLSFPVRVGVFLCACAFVCFCGLLSHSEANYFRGGTHLCGRATLHVGQTASADLHCLRVTLANRYLAMATVSLWWRAERVSHRLVMLQSSKCLNLIFCNVVSW